ncbi:MAG: hypothetical protein EXR72_18830 [Myxococcales bacterium]|nr:hypothetical protein [Myxococcales bacterium]
MDRLEHIRGRSRARFRRALELGCCAFLALAATASARPALDAKAFRETVRPILQRAGCAGPTCHGSSLIGMRLGPSGRDFERDLVAVARHVVPGAPGRSALLKKALGIGHLGGCGVAPKSCEEAQLAAWIRGRPVAACRPEVHSRVVAAELPAALANLPSRCASSICHGGPATPRLLHPRRPGAARVNAEALLPSLDRLQPTTSRLFHLLLGGEGHERFLDGGDDPLYRELFAWIAGEAVVGAQAPSFDRFVDQVHPLLVRRGCTNAGCHGSAANDLVLLAAAPLDNYLRLVPRIADGTFPRKPQNLLPHGGGRRLGGDEDCVMATIRGWLDGRPARPCTPRPPPDRARFAKLVQPSLETLTCPRCHADDALGFRFLANPTAAQLEENYRQVVAHVDLDYPAVSPVLLRVREDCMQARFLAWVDRQPDPGCTVDLRNFRGTFPTPPAVLRSR